MAKVYPQKMDMFLAADALRQEIGGKVTIMGAFAGGKILFPQDSKFPLGFPLAFLGVFIEGVGTFKTSLRISDPNGKPMGEDISVGDISKVPEQTMQVMVNFGFFVFPVAGKYKIEFMLDDHIYEQNISLSPAPLSILTR